MRLSFFLILKIILMYVVYFISLLIPRKRNRWVFGAGENFSDNAKYLYLYVNEKYPSIDIAWISSNKKIVKKLQDKALPAYYQYSFTGLKYLFSANIYCVANYLSFLKNTSLPFWSLGTAKYVQLWHGVGIKNVLYARDDDKTLKRLKHPLLKFLWLPILFSTVKKPDLFLSTSTEMTKHFSKCFRISKEKMITNAGYPRCFVFDPSVNKYYFDKYADKDSVRLKKHIQKFERVILYMPTFRESNINYLESAGINYEKLNSLMLSTNSLFIFKLHPWSKISLQEDERLTNLLFLDSQVDIYPFFNYVELLITDYSSVYYDYMLLDKGYTIFFDFDREEYIKERDLAYSYDEKTNGLKVKCFESLLDAISNKLYVSKDFEKDRELINFFWGKHKDIEFIVESIKILEN